MKKYAVLIFSMLCVANLLACSRENIDYSAQVDGMIPSEEIEAIFGNGEKNEKEEMEVSKSDTTVILTSEAENAEEVLETHSISTGAESLEYSRLFGNGSFDENQVWTSYNEEYGELVEALLAFCEESAVGSVMLATDEDVIFSGGFNAKETDGETGVNAFTTYEIGSLTQSFTATAILQQIQKGNLEASDTLDKFFPEYPHGSEISIDNLLHMDSGIPDYINESMKFFAGRTADEYDAFMNGEMADEEILHYLYKSELVFEPGKKAKYSNTNYYLLALILEQITGMKYEEYMQAYMFDACGLEYTTCTETGNLTSTPQGNGGYLTMGRVGRGAFDMHSNVCDILMFNRALMAGRLIDEEYLEYMTEIRNEYGCGWSGDNEGVLGQYGSTDAYICVNFIYQLEDENLYFIMMIPNGTKWAMPGNTLDVLEKYLE